MGLFDRLFGRKKEKPEAQESVQEAQGNLDGPEESQSSAPAPEQEVISQPAPTGPVPAPTDLAGEQEQDQSAPTAAADTHAPASADLAGEQEQDQSAPTVPADTHAPASADLAGEQEPAERQDQPTPTVPADTHAPASADLAGDQEQDQSAPTAAADIHAPASADLTEGQDSDQEPAENTALAEASSEVIESNGAEPDEAAVSQQEDLAGSAEQPAAPSPNQEQKAAEEVPFAEPADQPDRNQSTESAATEQSSQAKQLRDHSVEAGSVETEEIATSSEQTLKGAAPQERAAEAAQPESAPASENPAAEALSEPDQTPPVKDYYQELQARMAEARQRLSQEQAQEAARQAAAEPGPAATDAPSQDSEAAAPEPVQQETVQDKYDRSLKKTRTGFGARLNAFFANFRSVDEDFFEELEELLITSDVGVQVASNLTEDLRYEARLENAKKPDALRQLIIEKLVDIYEKDGQFNEEINLQPGLTVMLFVGVNGVGKTTSIGKLAYKYKQAGKKVMLVAADTFRAGAVAQLAEWGRRVDVPVVTGPEKSDPASVVYDGMERAQAEGVDILMIDTAGRLQNKDNLMAELEKIGRIIKRVDPAAPHETFLALDASTGQNALVQAKEFSKITPVTGIVLTKIDGTARGGVVLAIRQELDIPVKLIGFGEKIDDIGEFNSENFMRGLLEGLI